MKIVEQKKLELYKEKMKTQQEEKEKKNVELKIQEELKVKEEQKAEQQKFLKGLSEFNEANNAQWEIEIDNFVPQLQEIAATIGKQLKSEQLVTMGLLLMSQHHATLI